jgi:hypothetical protein
LQTLDNRNEGTTRFNENMAALKHNFRFRRYFKKMEKGEEKEKLSASANFVRPQFYLINSPLLLPLLDE